MNVGSSLKERIKDVAVGTSTLAGVLLYEVGISVYEETKHGLYHVFGIPHRELETEGYPFQLRRTQYKRIKRADFKRNRADILRRI